jgi:hypothetical protein
VHTEQFLDAHIDRDPGCGSAGLMYVTGNLTITNVSHTDQTGPGNIACWTEREIENGSGDTVVPLESVGDCTTDIYFPDWMLAPGDSLSTEVPVWDTTIDRHTAPPATYTIRLYLGDGTAANPITVTMPGCT